VFKFGSKKAGGGVDDFIEAEMNRINAGAAG
jgi:hypothetical protein